MTLILNNDEISAILEMGDVIAAMETAYRGLAEGSGVNRRRTDSGTTKKKET